MESTQAWIGPATERASRRSPRRWFQPSTIGVTRRTHTEIAIAATERCILNIALHERCKGAGLSFHIVILHVLRLKKRPPGDAPRWPTHDDEN
jgi:hypothetical protein